MSTIFAPITSIYNSSVSVIRISGKKSLKLAQSLGVKSIKANQTKFCKIKDLINNELIDEALVSYFRAPNSFTGEDVIEISIHSSPYIYKKISEVLLRDNDVRLAEAGEFSKIAFLNNKIDLVQAEAIVDLIKSETKSQHDQALKQLGGQLSNIYDNWRDRIIEILALIESAIDFPDEDLPREIVDLANKKVEELRREISSHLNDNKRGQKIKDGLRLSIIGAPNVGKSSLINFLAKSEVAIVSQIEGTTRDIIDIHLDIGGVSVIISDTAGIRQTNDLIEKEGIKRAFLNAKKSDLILFLDDNKNDISFLDEFKDVKMIKILNKVDLLEEDFENENFDVLVSLKNSTNLDLLIEKIEEKVKELIGSRVNPMITQERYRISLLRALESLNEFDLDFNIEIVAENLRACASQIARITGRIDVDDILDVIFSKFCIGK